MTIRARLLWLTFGLVAPLVLVGFFNLWSARQASRAQLNESVERQADLAATAFEQWIKAQRQTLVTISDLAQSNPNNAALKDYLNSIVKTRPNWLDVKIVNKDGEVVLEQSAKKWNSQTTSIETLKAEIERKKSLVVVTEQISEEKLRLLSLALPLTDGNFVVAQIDGASASDVFNQLQLPEANIIAVFDGNNQLLYRSRVLPEQLSLDVSQTPLLSAVQGRRAGIIEVESPYDKIRRVYGLARVETANCIVAVGIPSANLYEPARRQFARQTLLSLLITSLAVLAAFLIARSIVEPMRILTDAARAFGAGDLRARAEVEKNGAVKELGLTFNQMAEQIAAREEKLKELDQLKSEFVSSVSHELRTPLTTIKTLTRVLQRNKISVAERDEFLETIAAECDRQIEFVQNLLDLSRIESGAYKTSLAKTDVVPVLQNTIAAQRNAAVTRNLDLRFALPPDSLFALTDATALRRIVSSLLENAMKYTPENGQVTVSAGKKNERVEIEITDNGCGIAAVDLPRVFEKFYRGQPLDLPPNSETVNGFDAKTSRLLLNETHGIGLGLYLVKSLVGQIGGEITVESPVGKNQRGSRFTISVPVYDEKII
ncbi:MAG: ATP-binding protein [Pyrinomonadaceae bacterium]